jgi:hypothetical protein
MSRFGGRSLPFPAAFDRRMVQEVGSKDARVGYYSLSGFGEKSDDQVLDPIDTDVYCSSEI